MENVNAANTQNEHQTDSAVKVIWRTFWILLGITLVELTLGMFVAPHYHEYKHIFNGVYVILTLAKAFYIVAEFMHLRHEIKNLIMTIVVPLLLFVWFIIAFLADGNSYLKLRQRYNKPVYEQAKPQEHEQHGEEAKKPGKLD
jgi:cytochrome c oxidase subunit IV